jgi:hypothetical protein
LYSVQYWNGLPIKQIYGLRGADPEKIPELQEPPTPK